MTPESTLSEPTLSVALIALSAVRPMVFGAAVPMFVVGAPWVLRIAIGGVLAVALSGVLPAPMADGTNLLAAFLSEAGAGLALALAGGLGIWAAQAAGRAMGAVASPTSGSGATPVGGALAEALGVGAAATLLTAGLHRPLLRLLADSRTALPIGGATDWGLAEGTQAAIGLGGDLIAAAAALAAPAFAATVVVLAVVAALRFGAQRGGPRLAASMLHAPLSGLVVLAVVAGAASSGLVDDALLRTWEVGHQAAEDLVRSWAAGGVGP